MNRNKLILSIIGGVLGVAVLASAFFAWSAYSSKVTAMVGDEDEGVDGLENVVDKARQLSRKSVYPCAQSVRALESNTAAVVEWKADALKLASRGDRVYKPVSAAQFKTDIVAEAKRISAMAGAVNGAFVKAGFAFGPFKDFIAEGKMPADADVSRLQRQWDDVVTVVEILHNAGAVELVDVGYKVAKDEPQPEEQPRGKKAKKNQKKAKAAAVEKKVSDTYAYQVSFRAKPDAFVRAINAFATDERFITVESVAFNRGPTDQLATALGIEKKGAEANAAGSRRRGRRGAVQAEEPKKDDSGKNGIVTDPLADDPLLVTLVLSVTDFGSLAEEPNAKEGQK